MNRRDFLKGATASAAVAATGVSLPAVADIPAKRVEYQLRPVVNPVTFDPLISVNQRDEMGTRHFGTIEDMDVISKNFGRWDGHEWYTELSLKDILPLVKRS